MSSKIVNSIISFGKLISRLIGYLVFIPSMRADQARAKSSLGSSRSPVAAWSARIGGQAYPNNKRSLPAEQVWFLQIPPHPPMISHGGGP